jgi:hypothetical protein
MIGASTLDEYRKHIENDAVTIAVCAEVHEVQGDGALETMVTQDLRTGERGTSIPGPCSCSSVRCPTPHG